MRVTGQGNLTKAGLAAAVALTLAGCMESALQVTRSPLTALGLERDAEAAPATAPMAAQMQDGTTSEIIDGLLNRRSILPDGPYREIAVAVMAANARAAEAELRAARLREEARASNWLPDR